MGVVSEDEMLHPRCRARTVHKRHEVQPGRHRLHVRILITVLKFGLAYGGLDAVLQVAHGSICDEPRCITICSPHSPMRSRRCIKPSETSRCMVRARERHGTCFEIIIAASKLDMYHDTRCLSQRSRIVKRWHWPANDALLYLGGVR